MAYDFSVIIGYILFAVSELLPLLPFPTNGLLQTLFLGFPKSFKTPSKDIEMAQSCVGQDHEYASIINTLSSNKAIKTVVDDILKNPQLALVVSNLQNNVNLFKQFNNLSNNTQLQLTVDHLINNPQFNILPALSNFQTMNLIQSTNNDPHLSYTLNNLIKSSDLPNILNLLDRFHSNPTFLQKTLELNL